MLILWERFLNLCPDIGKQKWQLFKRQNLNQLSLEELLGFLMTYEQTMMHQEKEDSNKRKKILAFKSSNQKNNMKIKESNDENENLTLITKKFKSFLKMKSKKKQERRKKEESWINEEREIRENKASAKGEPSKKKEEHNLERQWR